MKLKRAVSITIQQFILTDSLSFLNLSLNINLMSTQQADNIPNMKTIQM